MSEEDKETIEKPPKDKEMTIWEHILELSMRLRVIIYSIFISTIVFMVAPGDLSVFENPGELLVAYKPLVVVFLEIVRSQVLPPDVTLIGSELTSGIELYLIVSILLGIMVSMPVIAYEIYKYVDPALYPHERRVIYPFMTSFLGLFIAGSIFGYFLLVRLMIVALLKFIEFVGGEKVIRVLDFYQLVFMTVLLTGLVFTLPAIFVLLVRFGILSTTLVTRNRRYIYVALYIVTAIITPDGGVFANVILLAPMIALLEAAVLIAKRYERKRLEEEMKKWPDCEFCGSKIPPDEVFCPKCKRSRL